MSGDPKQQPIKRRGFQPGVSGNPAGRPKKGQSLAEALDRLQPVEERASRLIALATCDDVKVCMQAQALICAYADGKPKDTMDLNHVGISPTQAALLEALGMTPHERRQKLEKEAPIDDDADDQP